jgi:hypothetical protein
MGTSADIFGGLGDIAGYFASDGERSDARAQLEKGRQGFAQLDPRIQAQETGPSAYASADPSTRAAQMSALSSLQNQYSQGGLDSIARANLADVQNQSNQQAHTQQAGIMEQANARGQGGGGNALVAQQLAGQQAAQRGSQQALQVAAQAQQGRQQALAGAAGIASGVRGQDYQSAGAQDAIARFNAQQRQGAAQDSYGNAFNRAAGMAGMSGQQYAAQMAEAKRTQDAWGGAGKMVGAGADAGENYLMNSGGGGGGGGGGGLGSLAGIAGMFI